MKPRIQKFEQKNRTNGIGDIRISTIRCRYCNKEGHIERECRKKQYDLRGKRKANDSEAQNALIQSDQNNCEENVDENENDE